MVLSFLMTFVLANMSQAFNKEKAIVGTWQITKIVKKKKVQKEGTFALFIGVRVVFKANKKLVIKTLVESRGTWKNLRGSNVRITGQLPQLKGKKTVIGQLKSKNLMLVYYPKKKVVVYLKKVK